MPGLTFGTYGIHKGRLVKREESNRVGNTAVVSSSEFAFGSCVNRSHS